MTLAWCATWPGWSCVCPKPTVIERAQHLGNHRSSVAIDRPHQPSEDLEGSKRKSRVAMP